MGINKNHFLIVNLKSVARIFEPLKSFFKSRLSKITISTLLKSRNEIFIELGAGDKKGKNGWVTIDIHKNSDIYWDLKNGIPFPNSSISKIYSSHFFEHLSFNETHLLLEECKRVLVDGGVFSICVPNARIYIDAYVNSATLENFEYFAYKPSYNNTSKIDYINYIAYMDGQHKYMFDEDNILAILTLNGFKNARLRSFDPNLDLKDRDFQSIYAEAEK